MLAKAVFSHYRRHPVQLLALVVMITLATMLWTGVSVLTDQARVSLAESEAAVAGRQQVVRSDGQAVTVNDFALLRTQGQCVAPWLEVQRPGAEGRVIGIDPLALGCFGGAVPGGTAGEQLGAPFMDISEAVSLAREQGYDSRLSLLMPDNVTLLPVGYRAQDFSMGPATGELADSFLLNLDALSVLVLLITGLLVRSVYRLGLAQRRGSFALLQRFGVPWGRLQWLLVLELVLISSLAIMPGLWLGSQLAGLLGGGFAQALDGLFDVTLYAGSQTAVPWSALWIMLALVMLVCLSDWLLPRHWQRGMRAKRLWRWLLPALALGVGLLLVALAPALWWVFAGTTLVLLGVGTLTPVLLAALADGLGNRSLHPLGRWRLRELAVMLRQLALPVVALQLAVATVLAVQALVTTFEATFDDWLDQRLAAPFYLMVPEDADGHRGAQLLAELDGVGPWQRVIGGRVSLLQDSGQRLPVDLFAVAPIGPLLDQWQLLDSLPQPWQRLEEGGLMVNEQLARRQGLRPGDSLTVRLDEQQIEGQIAGVYADYGRPAGEVMVSADRLPEDFSGTSESLSITPGEHSIQAIQRDLEALWGVDNLSVNDNASIRQLANRVFDQTFMLTRAISVLTLALAAVSLLIMGWVFFTTRAWTFQLLRVWGLPLQGVRSQLRRLAVTLTLAVAVAALPLGIWLTWVLVSRINPLAFGWSLPMAVYPLFWLELGVLCAGIGLVIGLLMHRQLKPGAPPPVSASGITGEER
ncbi:MAG: FtsX-like permease family protein [Halomonadaceae bacterium]|nr:MAG: FtsX-like permease family protein [Halomonadaceae bacterium]